MRRAIAVAAILAGVFPAGGCGAGAGEVPPEGSFSITETAQTLKSRLRPAEEGGAERGQVRLVVLRTTREETVVDDRGVATTVQSTEVRARLFVTVHHMVPSRICIVEIQGRKNHEVINTNSTGGFTLRYDLDGKTAIPSPGKVVTVREASSNPVLVGAIPGWQHTPRGEGRLLDEFGPGTGGETVRVGIAESTRTGDQLLEFRMAGLAPESAADLLLEDGGNGFVQVAGVAVDRQGNAVLRWSPGGSGPLPLGAASVAVFHEKPFQVRVGTGTMVEGVIP